MKKPVVALTLASAIVLSYCNGKKQPVKLQRDKQSRDAIRLKQRRL